MHVLLASGKLEGVGVRRHDGALFETEGTSFFLPVDTLYTFRPS